MITPAFGQDPSARRGLDFYAAAAPYTGLTLLALEWAAATPSAGLSGSIGSDRDGAYHLGRGVGCFVAQRSGATWMIVKRAPAVSEHARGSTPMTCATTPAWSRCRPPPRTVAGAR